MHLRHLTIFDFALGDCSDLRRRRLERDLLVLAGAFDRRRLLLDAAG